MKKIFILDPDFCSDEFLDFLEEKIKEFSRFRHDAIVVSNIKFLSFLFYLKEAGEFDGWFEDFEPDHHIENFGGSLLFLE